jgi:hypothetical protein
MIVANTTDAIVCLVGHGREQAKSVPQVASKYRSNYARFCQVSGGNPSQFVALISPSPLFAICVISQSMD